MLQLGCVLGITGLIVPPLSSKSKIQLSLLEPGSVHSLLFSDTVYFSAANITILRMDLDSLLPCITLI